MKKRRSVLLLCGLFLLLSACARPPAAESPSPVPTASGTPTPTPAPTPTPTPEPTPEPVSLPALPAEDYECCHIAEMRATLLLPKSWAGEYEISTDGWEEWGRMSVDVKDYPAGEPGYPSEGNVSVFRLVAMPTEEFEAHHLEGGTTQGWRDGLAQGRDVSRLWNWLGQRSGVTYAMWCNTSFQAAVNDEEKYALYRSMEADFNAYPADSSAYFIFDNP